ncbi:MAG: ketol-acid reductoisomerase [Bdellovibrionaceae bacterium]|nr:ketol-acid reductoisomerase [Pseudobdellovibrionaceae bacterium]
MEVQPENLKALKSKRVGILGYGNQGRAHALNLRDSGIDVVVGARAGSGSQHATADGFSVLSFLEAAEQASVLVFTLPDPVIPKVFQHCLPAIEGGKLLGFAHGFAYHFREIERLANAHYFLAAPKGAGVILRQNYERGIGLPVAIAAESQTDLEGTWKLAESYAFALGARGAPLRTSFEEETVCDLFGEQSVLCGGLMYLMESAFNTLREAGYSEEMAFFECCYEVQRIMDVFLRFGPVGTVRRISPTAFFGGVTRGNRVLNPRLSEELHHILSEIQKGDFGKEWKRELSEGGKIMETAEARLRHSAWQKTFERMGEVLVDPV